METEQQLPESQPVPTSPRTTRSKFVWVLLALLVIFGSFRYGLHLGGRGFVFEPKEFRVVNQKDQVFDVDYNLLWDAIAVINEKFIDKPVDQQKILYGAIRGAVAATGDDYTEYYDPEELKVFQDQLAGSFQGIGAEIDKKEGNIVIVAPIEGSPAKAAGLRPNDIIVSVGDQATTDWSADEVARNIRGPAGTEVTLTIYRESEARTFEVTIKRALIELKSVKLEVREQSGKKIAVISVARFGDDTRALFQRAVSEARARNVSGVILDLRNDPGGYLDGAVDMASYWLPKNDLIVTEARSDGTNEVYKSAGFNQFTGLKTIVLINQGSASASEIVAGALRDHNAATLMGEKSFGKGSVQELIQLRDNSAVKVTVAKWITPGGKNLNHDGLVPDIEVKLTDEDFEAKRDPQLDRALEEIIK